MALTKQDCFPKDRKLTPCSFLDSNTASISEVKTMSAERRLFISVTCLWGSQGEDQLL